MNEVNICFSSDNNYAKYLGVSIKSLIETTNKSNNYNIYVLDGGISELNKIKIQSLSTDNCKIIFLDIKRMFSSFNFDALHVDGHISVATYYRLFLPGIFKDLSKIIYADCDVVFNHDVADLYNTDLTDEHLFAAVKDIGILYYESLNKIDHHYFDSIGFHDIEQYFNAGVLLYNLDAIKKCNHNIFEYINKIEKPKFHDQCILNIFAKDRVKFVPMNWNYWGNFKLDYPKYLEKFPHKYLEEFEQASKNPYIIHGKPWLNPDNEWSEIFFKYARMTPFYESIIYENTKRKTQRKEIKFLGFKIKYKI